jgi:protein phosphatase
MRAGFELEFASVSDPGLKRSNNEDSAITDTEIGLALVADGMGGYKAGEVASAIAAKVVLDDLRAARNRHQFRRIEGDETESREVAVLRAAIESANLHIFETARRAPQCRGMGTTIVAALFSNSRITVAHVGDSRLYRLREGHLEQVTNDHSLMQELIDKGFYSVAEAEASTPKNLVTRALGIEETVTVDVQEMTTAPGDVFLLCSDGLTDMVSDKEIRGTLERSGGQLERAARALIELANEGGGKDNISVVLARPLAAGRGGLSARLQALWPRNGG